MLKNMNFVEARLQEADLRHEGGKRGVGRGENEERGFLFFGVFGFDDFGERGFPVVAKRVVVDGEVGRDFSGRGPVFVDAGKGARVCAVVVAGEMELEGLHEAFGAGNPCGVGKERAVVELSGWRAVDTDSTGALDGGDDGGELCGGLDGEAVVE